jgi:GntR family transcriptional regulator/MocR family aminotransferase
VCDYLVASRGVKCTPGQVVIVSGVQEALDLTARLFLDRGDPICIESPGYPGAARIFEVAGARIRNIGLDREGMKRPRGSARLAYLTPGHQFPIGMTMSLGRRLALLDWAQASGALIFEDDYDGEYRFAGRPMPALQGLDRRGLVLFSGSFSKVLFPSLRLGYLVVPPDLVPHFTAAKSVFVRHPPVLDQAVLCDFIAEGHFGRHLRRMRQVYAERLSILQEAARRELAGLLEISGVEAGLQTAGWLRQGLGAEAAARAAARRGIEVTPLRSCGPPAREGLVLGFAAVDGREIRRGVAELAAPLSMLYRFAKASRRAFSSAF